MLIGMGVVFTFLIILIIYMKFVPILSKRRKIDSKFKLNSVLDQISVQPDEHEDLTEAKVAAIAAAIYSHTGKKPKQIVITTPTGTVEQINLWGIAGRQDIMITRDITGQVGFQY